MSDIKAGDLVMIVRNAPCGCTKSLGQVFNVKEVYSFMTACVICGHIEGVRDLAEHPDGDVVQLYRLKKIDPPALPETIETQDEITA
jgi:hypothetical protein